MQIPILLLFLALNFAALGIGGSFTGAGVPSDWYQNLDKAPWTPPGWVFGAAWTTIMVLFAFFMAFAWKHTGQRQVLIGLFALQWILNVLWNPVFFKYHQVLAGLIIIAGLTFLTAYFLVAYRSVLGAKTLLVLPYVLWLIIATSLNAYILMKN